MGTTSDKLTYLNTTKTKIKDAINLANTNITNETFRQYESKIKQALINTMNDKWGTWANFEKVTGTGETLTLNNTSEAPMKIDLKGNTSQYSTTGKNKFSTDFKTTDNLTTYTKIDSNSFSFTCSGTWKGVTFVVPCKENTDYYFNYTKKVDGTYCYIKGTQTNTDLMTKYYGYFNSFNSGANTTLTITISNGNNSNITSDTIYNIQLEEGTTTTSFEKYSGGNPAPNPTYPQDVNVVSGDNTIKICGKNLYNKDAEKDNFYYSSTGAISFSSGNYFTTQRIERISDSYAVSMKAQHQGGGIVPYVRFVEYKKDGTFIQRQTTIGSATITLHNDTSYFLLNVDAGPNAYYEELQIEMGETASTYQEYQAPQTQLISLGSIELCKIGDYQDYIYKENDNWYIHKEIGKVILDGSEDGWSIGGSSGHSLYVYSSLTNFVYVGNIPQLAYCNYFTNANVGSSNDVLGFFMLNSGALRFREQTMKTLENWKIWLSTNNLILYYVLKTPTNTIITDTTLINQLDNLQNLTSYNPTTNIMQENNDKPFILDATLLKEV